MAYISVEQFYGTLAAIFRKKSFRFDMSMTSADVPGWDSLRHVVLIMELNRVAGTDLSPEDTASLQNIGELYQALLGAPRAT